MGDLENIDIEFYDIVFYDEMIRIYDEEYPKFVNVVGLKAPN